MRRLPRFSSLSGKICPCNCCNEGLEYLEYLEYASTYEMNGKRRLSGLIFYGEGRRKGLVGWGGVGSIEIFPP